jgi:hypothetical protein
VLPILEPEVHIVERYMQLVKNCFTMTNVMLDGGKEIDLLAISADSERRYHVEVRIATGSGFKLRLVDTKTKDNKKHRRGMDTLNEMKFSHPTVVKAINRLFGGQEYSKILVVWAIDDSNVITKSRALYGVNVWRMPQIISELTQEVETKAYRDDVLRTIQLITKRKFS